MTITDEEKMNKETMEQPTCESSTTTPGPNAQPSPHTLEQELSFLLNKFSRENESDTPDFILAGYLMDCLRAFESAMKSRGKWNTIPTQAVEHDNRRTAHRD